MQQKILLVDDREDNLLSIEVILAKDGYQFFKASSGREALKILLSEVDFSLILMDVKMPILNGFETANMIHQREKVKDIPIIFISANNYGDENIYKGYQSGGIDYILKPINPEILRAKVSVFVNLREKSRLLIEQEIKLRNVNEILGVEINDRRAIEEKIEKINEELHNEIARLKTINRNLTQLVFLSAYESKKPLEEIASISKQLIKGNNHENGIDLNRLESASQNAQRGFADLLTISGSVISDTKFIPCDLNEVIAALLKDIEQEALIPKATIKVESLPKVLAVPELMSSLFHNLIDNAVTSGREKNKPFIKVSSKLSDKMNGNSYQILVEDNGEGFAEKNTEEIFRPSNSFENGKSSIRMSLALCKRIMEIHNGSISAQSEPGKGSTFILSFPIDRG